MLKISKNEPLAKFSSFKIGGSADHFVRVKNKEDFISAIQWANKRKLPFFVLGGGTNVLFADANFQGLVIKNEMNSIQLIAASGLNKREKSTLEKKFFIRAESGVLINRLVRYTLDHNLSGLENFLGQPGTVGGAVYINAHNLHKKDYFGEHIIEAEVLNKYGEERVVGREYFQFGYEYSSVQKSAEIVVWVTVEAVKRNSQEMKEVWGRANEVVNLRQNKQPYGFFSAGCIFKNISPSDARRLQTPNLTTSAGFLIEACGLKEKKIGQAIISGKHANFILNLGGAQAHDVIKLIKLIKNKVWQEFKIKLEEEIIKVGNFR